MDVLRYLVCCCRWNLHHLQSSANILARCALSVSAYVKSCHGHAVEFFCLRCLLRVLRGKCVATLFRTMPFRLLTPAGPLLALFTDDCNDMMVRHHLSGTLCFLLLLQKHATV
jgi:hypothetical protein